VLAGLGAEFHEATIPHAEQILGTQWAILMPEAAAYHQETLRSSGDLHEPDVRLSLEVGEMVLATDYIRALRMRTLLQQTWAGTFDGIDVLIAPTMPFAAPAVGQEEVTWADGSTEDVHTALVRLTCPINLVGLPSLSLPVGADDAGLPLGMQVVGRPFDEATALRVGALYEAATDTVGRIAPVG
jgi:aspartyl-tRNA(Asn)/glutamyl-tRNA(Gln) amidotransferase subunit A